MNFTTANEITINVTEGTLEHMQAHSDVNFDDIREAIKLITFDSDFFIEAVDLGRVIGKTSCVELNENDEILYFYRKNRLGKTPFVKNRDKSDTSKIVICIGKNRYSEEHEPILITAFYGDKAPMEPWDARNKNCDEKTIEECDIFWNTHALVYDEDMIDFTKEDI